MRVALFFHGYDNLVSGRKTVVLQQVFKLRVLDLLQDGFGRRFAFHQVYLMLVCELPDGGERYRRMVLFIINHFISDLFQGLFPLLCFIFYIRRETYILYLQTVLPVPGRVRLVLCQVETFRYAF